MSTEEIARVTLRAVMVDIKLTDDVDEMQRRMVSTAAIACEAQQKMVEDLPRKYAEVIAKFNRLAEKGEAEKGEKEKEEVEKERKEILSELRALDSFKTELSDLRGINRENEYLIERQVRGLPTVYRTTDPAERRRLTELAMHRHMLSRGVDYTAALERVREGTATEQDEAVVEYAYYHQDKAGRPLNMLWAARRMDEEKDRERDEKEREEIHENENEKNGGKGEEAEKGEEKGECTENAREEKGEKGEE